LNCCGIGIYAHFTPERIDFANDVALCQAPDRWVAAHLADGVEIHRQKKRLASHSSGRESGLDPSMPSPDHDYIVILGEDKIG
jgi:hypothetical protein